MVNNNFLCLLISMGALFLSCDTDRISYLPEPPENPILREENPDEPKPGPEPDDGKDDPVVATHLELPYIISDHMILQQNAMVSIYGTHDAGVQVTVAPSWTQEQYAATTAGDGNWMVKVKTPAASSTSYTIEVSDSEGGSKTIEDILIGEVWLCAGQSNMEHPMKGFNYGMPEHEPVDGYSSEISDSEYPELRYFRVPKNVSREPLMNCGAAAWRKSTRQDAPDWSAIGFFFGRSIHKKLGIPVGIVACPYGGTRIEGWMPASLVSNLPVNTMKTDGLAAGEMSPSYPSNSYNAMMNPVMDYGFRGMLWFQGESNADALAWAYAGHMRDIVSSWRNRMGISASDLPFYYVQLAPWESSWEDGALLRHCQFRGVGFGSPLIENCGIVGSADVGSRTTIHFPQKKVIADRLVLWAMYNQYGDKSVNPMGPSYHSHVIEGNKVLVRLDNSDGIRFAEGVTQVLFAEVAPAPSSVGGKTVYDWSEAAVEILPDGRLSFSSPSVPNPVHARYCYATWHQGTIYNGAGLPLFPFSTEKYSKTE